MRNSNLGYTVIELLAVVAILVTVTGVIAAMVTQTLRGGGRSSITNEVSQSGNYVTSVITNSAIYAENVTAVNGDPVTDCTQNPTGTSIDLFMSSSGGTIRYACSEDTISSNGASLIDTTKIKAESCFFTCKQQDNDPYTPPIIEFGFVLSQLSDNALYENREQAPFETSILMRNYRQN